MRNNISIEGPTKCLGIVGKSDGSTKKRKYKPDWDGTKLRSHFYSLIKTVREGVKFNQEGFVAKILSKLRSISDEAVVHFDAVVHAHHFPSENMHRYPVAYF